MALFSQLKKINILVVMKTLSCYNEPVIFYLGGNNEIYYFSN